MQWIEITADSAALEIVGLGVVIRDTNSMCFVPGARIRAGEIVKEMREQPQLGGTRSVKVLDEDPDW